MIKHFVQQLMLLTDSGKLLKSPFKWIYVIMGALCFIPFIICAAALIWQWDAFFSLIEFVGSSFWTDFVTSLILVLAFYSLIMYALLGWYFWKNRNDNLEHVVRKGSRIVAIPLIADVIKSKGELNSLFLVFYTVTLCVLAYLGCMLTNSFEFWTNWGGLLFLAAAIVIILVVVFVAYLNVLFVHFLSERLRIYAQIGDDVHHIASSNTREPIDPKLAEYTGLFDLDRRQKRGLIIAFCSAIVIALAGAVTVVILNVAALRTSVYEPLSDHRVHKVAERYPGFLSAYDLAREKAEQARYSEFKELTYVRVYEFKQNYLNNEDFEERIRQRTKDEYTRKYLNPNQLRIDETLRRWKQFTEEHDPNRYLQITVHTNYFKEESWYSYYDRPQWWFSYTEPNGKVAKANIFVCPRDKNGKKHEAVNGWTYSFYEIKRASSKNRAEHMERIDDAAFWDRYTMQVTINSVTLADGREIKASDLKQVPASVRTYLANKTEDNLVAMVKDQIDPDFMSRDEYVAAAVEQALKERDELCYRFLMQ